MVGNPIVGYPCKFCCTGRYKSRGVGPARPAARRGTFGPQRSRHGPSFAQTEALTRPCGYSIYGCQSSPNLSGGVVAPYGTNISAFRDELAAMREDWISAIRKPAA